MDQLTHKISKTDESQLVNNHKSVMNKFNETFLTES